MRSWSALMLTGLLVSISLLAFGQDPPEQAPPQETQPDEIVTVVPPTERMTTRIAFVIDVSGSMRFDNHAGRAIGFSRNILGQEGDELEVAIFAFRGGYERWPGVEHDGDGPPPPKGWTQFPGVPQLRAAEEWLNNLGADGETEPEGAVGAALAEKVENLTVVIITDGVFGQTAFKEAVAAGQAAREKAGLGKAVIIVVGIGYSSENQGHLREVGKAGGGGFYVIRRPGERVEDEEE